MWKLHVTRVADLGYHDYRANLLHLVVIRWRGAVEIASYLDTKIGDGDEALENVLRHNICVMTFFVDIVRRDVDVVSASTKVGGCNGSGTPFGFGGEGLLLELRCGGHDYVLAVNILSLRGDGSELLLFLLLLLDLGCLLALHGRGTDLHTKDDVSDFAGGQTGGVNVVLLAVIIEDEISQLHFNLDPVFVRQGGPNMVLLGNDCLVRSEQQLGLVLIDMQCTQDKDQSRKCSVRRDRLEPLIVEVEEHHFWFRRAQDHVT